MSPQPQARKQNGLPEDLNKQTVRERLLSLQKDITNLQSAIGAIPENTDTLYDDTALAREVGRLRYELDRHSHRSHRGDGTGSGYEGHFKIEYASGSSVTVGNGWVALRDQTLSATGGTIAIGATDGYHYVLVQVWYKGGWKYQIVDSTGGYPNRVTTVNDGGMNYECYQQVIGILQVAGGAVQETTVVQIIHDEAVNLIDWTAESDGQFRVVKSTATSVAISAGAVICGTETIQVSNTTETIPTASGTYYLAAEVYYDLGSWVVEYSAGSSYPVQSLDTFKKLIAKIVVRSSVIEYIAPVHSGEIVNPRIAE